MSDVIANGFWYVDPKTGEKKWLTGDMLLAMVRTKAGVKSTEALASAVGKQFAEERAAWRAEIGELRAEVSLLKATNKLRRVA